MLFAAGLSAQTPSTLTKVVETYCSGCHNGRVEPSGARLTAFDPTHIADSPELWSRVERHLRAGTMPPVGSKRAAIERELDTPAPAVATSQAKVAKAEATRRQLSGKNTNARCASHSDGGVGKKEASRGVPVCGSPFLRTLSKLPHGSISTC